MKKLATWIYKTSEQLRSKLEQGRRLFYRRSNQSHSVTTESGRATRTNGVITPAENHAGHQFNAGVKTEPSALNRVNEKFAGLPKTIRYLLLFLAASASLLTLYAILGFYLLPAVLKAKLPDYLQEETGKRVALKNVEFDPFNLIAKIQGFNLKENNGNLVIGFDQFYIDINGTDSLRKRALIIDDITLIKPVVQVTKQKDGKLDLENLIKPKKKPESKPKDEGLFPVAIHKLSIKDGKVVWHDKHFTQAVSEELSPVNLNVSQLSTLANTKGKLELDINIKSGGKLSLKAGAGINPVFSEGLLKLDKLSLQKLIALALSDTAPFELKGSGQSNLEYKLGYDKKDLKLTLLKSRLEFQDFAFMDKGANKTLLKTPHFAFESDAVLTIAKDNLDVAVKKAAIASRDFKFSKEMPEALAIEVPDFNHEMDIKVSRTKDGATVTVANAKFALKNLKFSGMKNVMTVVVPELTHEGDITVSQSKDGLTIASKATKIALNNFQFSGLNRDKVKSKIPQINLETDYQLNLSEKTIDAIVNQGKFSLNNLELSDSNNAKPLIKIPLLSLNGIGVNLAKQEVLIDLLAGKNAEFEAWLNKDGTINYQDLLAGHKTAPEETVSPAATARMVDFDEDGSEPDANMSPANKPKKDWLVKINHIALENFGLTFEDKSLKKPVLITAKPVNFKLSNFDSKLNSKLPFQFDAGVNKTGSIKLKGDAVISPLQAKIEVDTQNIDLDTFQPYADKFAKVDIIDGKFNIKGLLHVKQEPKKPIDIKFKGNTGIDDLITRDQILNKDLVKWRSLNFKDVNADVAANRYTANTLIIEKPYARVTIRKDKTVNFSDLTVNNTAPDKPVKTAATKQTQTTDAKKPYFLLNQVKIVDGSSDFADLSLILPFAAQIKSLNGGANGISSEQKSTIKLDLKGNAYDLAPVDVSGEVSPYLGNYTVELNFQHLPMPLVTPYMAQFAGYKIEKGMLTLGLKYQVENRKLNASNNILIDQLELGEKVDNPNAVSLPLELAITLLKDSDGKIKLDVPLTGSLEDPEFSYGHIITDALLNVLTKIVSAPFNAIASLVGGGSDEDLSQVAFKAGAFDLDSKEQTKLDNISKALKEKTALNIEIKGAAFTELDWPALQDDALLDQLKQRKADQLSKEEGKKVLPEYVELNDDDYKEMLAEAFIEKFPNLAEKSIFGTPKLINADAGDFYEIAKQKMSQVIKPDPERLKDLANKRSQAIAKHLVQKAGITNDRVYILDSVLDPEREGKDIASILSLKTN